MEKKIKKERRAYETWLRGRDGTWPVEEKARMIMDGMIALGIAYVKDR